MGGVAERDLRTLVDFMYHGELEVGHDGELEQGHDVEFEEGHDGEVAD